jgi:hypothetical protein
VALAAVAVCTVACGGSRSHHYKEESRLPSPGGTSFALIYSDSGPENSGWCSSKVAIFAKASAVDLAYVNDQRQFVFVVPCRADVKLTWQSEAELNVQYTVTDDWISVFQQKTGRDGRVHVVYSPKS